MFRLSDMIEYANIIIMFLVAALLKLIIMALGKFKTRSALYEKFIDLEKRKRYIKNINTISSIYTACVST